VIAAGVTLRWRTGGRLDFDSNENCILDGRREENVFWPVEPPHGRYIVRVDTFSLCGQPGARFGVTVNRNGQIVAQAEGRSVETDTRGPHGAGAGLTMLELDVNAVN